MSLGIDTDVLVSWAMVGTLLEIGYGRLDEDGLKRLLGGRPRGEAGMNVSAHGLVLVEVRDSWSLGRSSGLDRGSRAVSVDESSPVG